MLSSRLGEMMRQTQEMGARTQRKIITEAQIHTAEEEVLQEETKEIVARAQVDTLLRRRISAVRFRVQGERKGRETLGVCPA